MHTTDWRKEKKDELVWVVLQRRCQKNQKKQIPVILVTTSLRQNEKGIKVQVKIVEHQPVMFQQLMYMALLRNL